MNEVFWERRPVRMVKKICINLIKKDIASVTIVVIAVCLILSLTTEGFTSAYNIDSLVRIISVMSVVGFAQLMTLSIGHFNLALISMAAMSGVFTGALMEVYGVNAWLAIIIGMSIGIFLGCIQGFLIVKTGINPFIITLSLASIIFGTAMVVTRSGIYMHLPDEFRVIGTMNIIGAVPLLLIITIVIALILGLFMYYLPIGRKILAVGANERAAFFSGINTPRIIILTHAMSGLLAGIAGMLEVSRLGSAQLSIGRSWLLISFAAPVLGGTLLSGGKISVAGTILGSVLMNIIVNALVLYNISANWFQLFMGIILLTAFEVDKFRLNLLAQKK